MHAIRKRIWFVLVAFGFKLLIVMESLRGENS